MWNNKSVSVVLMTYAEKDSIRQVILDFYATGVVDEVVVIDNNAETGTVDEVATTPARLIKEPKQGYGYATRRGLKEADGDLVVLAEPDRTFLAEDVFKLLAFSDQFDVVFGTRTFRQLIWPGANMALPLRLGNILVAKYLQTIFRSAKLTDVGCTYRLLSRAAVDKVLPILTIGGSQLGPELMIRVVLSRLRHVEVPVNYLPRVGVSSVTGNRWKTVILGTRMVVLISWLRIRTIGAASKQKVNWEPRSLPASPLSIVPQVPYRPKKELHLSHDLPEGNAAAG